MPYDAAAGASSFDEAICDDCDGAAAAVLVLAGCGVTDFDCDAASCCAACDGDKREGFTASAGSCVAGPESAGSDLTVTSSAGLVAGIGEGFEEDDEMGRSVEEGFGTADVSELDVPESPMVVEGCCVAEPLWAVDDGVSSISQRVSDSIVWGS